MSEAVIVAAIRTPIGRFLGGLSSLSATELASRAVAGVLQRANLGADDIDEIVMGNVIAAGLGMNPARQAALGGGLPSSIAAYTVNKVCGSGLKSVMLAAQSIRAGDAEIVLAGGLESMSNAPHLLLGARNGIKYGDQNLTDAMLRDGLWCSFEDWHVGSAAEYIAEKYKITREEQDQFALQSHQRAVAAAEAGRFDNEILPIEIRSKKGTVTVNADESPRSDTSLEKLAALPTVFRENGTITPGNAPGLNDGAAAVVVMSEEAASSRGLVPLASIRGYAVSGVDPRVVFIAPVLAVKKVLKRCGLSLSDMDAIEINEAFSAQMLACRKDLQWDDDRMNVNGGAIALGHPLGASGTRVLVTLLNVLKQREGRFGLVSLCLGGGNAVAMVVERPPD